MRWFLRLMYKDRKNVGLFLLSMVVVPIVTAYLAEVIG